MAAQPLRPPTAVAVAVAVAALALLLRPPAWSSVALGALLGAAALGVLQARALWPPMCACMRVPARKR